MDKFEESEIIGRNLTQLFLELFGVNSINFTKEKYDPVDFYTSFTSKEKLLKVVGEIKVRAEKYYNYNTHLIELKKYDALIECKKEQLLDGCLYINFFGTNKLVVYSIDKIADNSKLVSKCCRKTTAVESDFTNKIFMEFPKECGTTFIKQNNKWIKL